MTDIILDERNDITFKNNDFNLFEEYDNNLIAQRLEIKLRSYFGEWFRDVRYGIPWFQEIFTRRNKKDLADTYIKRTIQQDRDVRSITKYTSTVSDSKLKVVFTAKLNNGDTATLNLEF